MLREALDGVAEVRRSKCLHSCPDTHVLVVHPSPAARAAGAKPLWLGRILDDQALSELVGWMSSDDPGLTTPPPSLRDRTIPPPHPRCK
ncbi:(2Fe-2S) ferredoxin domain-containing protein [Saccharothrix xinjiangensis]|uniref:(2Fe-2S) ferredoxin domain-containing protein n=1 Tax=Saccharothrix xinjiangensis TaxID=204798 RepID=A0ABV9Y0M1_9PSEU